MYRALQTIVLRIDGRELQLTEGEPVALSVIEGTVLAAGGYVEQVSDETPEYQESQEYRESEESAWRAPHG